MNRRASSPLGRLRLSTLALLLAGNAALLLFGFLWLHVPDSRTWQLCLTFVFGAALFLSFLWLWSTAIRRIRIPAILTSGWLSGALLALWLTAGHVLCHLASRIDVDASRRAGYWNSQLGPHLRATLTYERLLAWQHDLVTLLVWIIVPALLLPFLIETVARGPRSNTWTTALRVLFSWKHWLAVIFAFLLVYWSTEFLLRWHPAHSVRGELISVAFRVLLVYVIDVLLLALLLAWTPPSYLLVLRPTSSPAKTPAGTPLRSHPRTVTTP